MVAPHTVHLIVNPKAANGKALKVLPHLSAAFHRRSIVIHHRVTEYPLHATEIVRSLDGAASTIVGVGGDGTVNEIVNGLHLEHQSFGIMPSGTGDDFARITGMRSAEDVVDAVMHAKTKYIDLAHISFTEEDGTRGERLFANTMGIGFDAAVADKVLRNKRGTGIIPYLGAVISTLRKFTPVPSRIEVDGESIEQKIFLASIGNGTTSGGGFILSPLAKLDDGLLDLCLVKEISTRRVLVVLPKTFRGNHLNEPELIYRKGKSFSISLERPLPIHTDGEIITRNVVAVHVSVFGKKLSVLSQAQ